MSFSLSLPWMPAMLSPNARGNWRKKETSRKKYKSDCYLLAKQARPHFGEGNIEISILFHPPRKNRDLDNCLAAFKYGLDGIAEAWGVNDRMFRPIKLDFGPTEKNGRVEVQI